MGEKKLNGWWEQTGEKAGVFLLTNCWWCWWQFLASKTCLLRTGYAWNSGSELVLTAETWGYNIQHVGRPIFDTSLGSYTNPLSQSQSKVTLGPTLDLCLFETPLLHRRGVFSIITTQTWSGQKRPKPRHFRHGTSPNLVNIARFLDVSAKVVSFLLLQFLPVGILEPTKCTGSGALYGAPQRHEPHREEGMGV